MMENEENQVTEHVIENTLRTSLSALSAALNDKRGEISKERPFVFIPNGDSLEVLDLERHMPAPSRIEKSIAFSNTDSFISYFESYRATHTPVIFVKDSNEGARVLAVMDYDKPANVDEDSVTLETPSWNKHLAYLELNFHPFYKRLRDNSGEWFSQEDFSHFVEENLALFVSPDSATMLEIAQDLKGTVNAQWKSGARLNNGQRSLEYSEQIEGHTTKGSVTVPERLKFNCPIYDGKAIDGFEAAFSWRVNPGGNVVFQYRLLTQIEERAAQEAMIKAITENTGLPVLRVSSLNSNGGMRLL